MSSITGEDHVAQYTHSVSCMTADALLCYSEGIAHRLASKIAALDFRRRPVGSPIDSDAIAVDVADVFERYYECVSEALDQLHAVEQEVADRLTDAKETVWALAAAQTPAILDRRGSGRNVRGRGR